MNQFINVCEQQFERTHSEILTRLELAFLIGVCFLSMTNSSVYWTTGQIYVRTQT